MSIAAYLAKLSEGVNSSGILATSKGGTGTTSGGAFPTIASISYGGDENDTATDTNGGRTVTITGANFVANAKILINGVMAPVVTVVSASTITFTTPAMAAGTYVLYMVNADGSTAIAVPGISYSGVPLWSTAAGTVATATETLAVSGSLSATSNSAVTLSLLSGVLPPGAVLNSNGTISGTSAVVSGPTTYTFTVRATDVELQDTDRQFSIVINPDVITFTNPVSSSTVTLNQNESSTVVLTATTTTGNTIASYSANTLPPGMTLTGSTVSGTPTTLGTTASILTATSNITAKTGTSTFTWSVVVSGDIYWKNTTLLLPGTAFADSFVTDYSLNNFQPTVVGDTRANSYNPYQTRYYSNQFSPGQTNYIQTTIQAMTGNFTVECWVYITSLPNSGVIIGQTWELWVNTSGTVSYYTPAAVRITTSLTVPLNTWTHVALVRSSGITKIYINGVADAATYTDSGTVGAAETTYIGRDPGASGGFNGSISNLRIVNGTAVYTANFTPSTTPLTAISGTTLLTCQANRFIDAGPNNYAVTRTGTPPVQPFNPFGVPASVTVNNLYSTYFDGAGDYLAVPSNAAFAIGTGDFTIEFWFNTSSISQTGYIYTSDSGANGLFVTFTGSILRLTNSSTVFAVTPTLLSNTWYHIAVVRTGTSSVIYTNGVAGTAVTCSINFTQAGPAIGSNNYLGYISNMHVVKGTAVYTANFTPATTNLTAITNTSLLTCQDATLKDNSVNAFAITSVGQAQPVAQSPFTQTTTTVPLTTVGSAYFDGTGDQLSYANNPAFAFFTSNFTVEYWMYPLSASAQSVMNYSNGQTTSSNFAWEMYQANGTTIQFTILDSDGASGYTASSTGLLINRWNHIAAVRNGNTMSLYVNGVVGGTVATVTGVSVFNKASATLKVSGYNNATTMYTGYIEDMRIVKGTAVYTANFDPPTQPLTAVTNTQLLTLQTSQPSNNSQFIDNSPAANLVTRFGNTTQGSFSPYGSNWSGFFDNSSIDNIVATSIPSYAIGTGNFTVEFFINFNYWTGLQRFFIQGVSGTDGLTIHRPNTNNIEIGMSNTYPIVYAWTPVLGQWYHMALVRTGTGAGQLALYINGVSVATGTSAASIAQNQVIVGGLSWGSLYNVRGSMSNVRYSNIARTITVPTAPYQPDANTILLTCQDNRFVDNSPLNNTITRNGSAATQRFSPFSAMIQTPQTYSAYFDGSGDYLTVPNINFASNNFTIEGWFYINSLADARNFWGTDNGSGSTPKLILYITGTAITVETGSIGGAVISVTAATYLTIGTWNHIAVVRTGTGTNQTKLYINGVNVGSGTLASTSSITQPFNIGYIGEAYGQAFSGYISDFRIVNGTAVYTTPFVPPIAPLTATTNTVLLTCQSNRFIDTSSNAFTITASGDTKPRAFNPFGYTNTTLQAYTPALYGASAYFDGSGDYLTSTILPIGTGNFTIECWVNTAVLAEKGILQTSDTVGGFKTSYTTGVVLAINPSGNWRFIVGATTLDSTTPAVTNTWTHVAVTRSSNAVKCFVNGVMVQSGTASDNLTGQYVVIGSYYNTTYIWNGYISNVCLINGTALYTTNFVPPQAPVTATKNTTLLLNMNKAAITDYTRSVDLETVGDAKITTESAYNGLYYSNYLDGTGDYLITPNLGSLTTDFTIELWYYPEIPTNTWYPYVFGSNTPWTTGIGMTYNTQATVTDATTLNVQIAGASISFGTYGAIKNKWNHIAISRVGSVITGYLNGATAGTLSNSATIVTTTWYIGGVDEGGNYDNHAIKGSISNFRIIKGTGLYSGSTITVPTAPLTAVTNTALLTCQSNKFIDASTNVYAITRNGNAAVKSFNPFVRNTNTSMLFDGTGDALPIPYSPVLNLGAGNFTIEFWSYVNATPTTEGYFFSIGPAGSGAANRGLRLGVHNSIAAGIYFWAGGVAGNAETLLGSFPTAGAWNHIAFVRNGTTVTGYVNGIALGTTFNASTTSISDMSVGDYSFVAGLNSSGGTPRLFYNGYLEDLRVTKGVARYTANFTPPSAKLQTK